MPSLTQLEARSRADLLTVTAYRIELDLTGARTDPTFGSTTTIEFDCRRPGAETFAEVRARVVHEIALNGVAVDPETVQDNRIPLTGLAGSNVLVVRATMDYSNTGQGLHRFTDPADGEVYLYAQSALDDAQRSFACFDQPDLKAPISLAVSAPAGWTVWGNAAAGAVQPARWECATTPPIPPYLFTVVAGPYYCLTAEHDGIPLGLLARRSLAQHLDASAEELFAVTRGCFDEFHRLFGIRYPFGKYDQAFVPEFTMGAMENPGCVTFRDEMVFRSAVTEADLEKRAVIMAHEMAHMWFGDLVTMAWWDDLWLNESFAEYMGWRVAAVATPYRQAWTSFSVWRKGQGYTADQRPSTHPIAPDDVPDTEHAMLNVDGISYAKGASALRQLAAWMGDEAFFEGLRAHLRAHEYGNATLADLLGALAAATPLDVAGWARAWLLQPQVNTLRPEVSVDAEGRYTSVVVRQTAPAAYPTLRPHRIGVASYAGHSPARPAYRVEVDLDPTVDNGQTPVPELAGREAGRLLLLNDGDLTFAKVRFDPRSRAELPRVLPDLEDPLARALVWSAAADATRDAELAPAEFLALAAAGLPAETVTAVFEDMLAFAGTVARTYLAGDDRAAGVRILFDACTRTLAAAEPGSSRQLAAAKGLLACAGADAIPQLEGWLAGDGGPGGLEIDAELRWTALQRLAALGVATPERIAAESARDATAGGSEHAVRCLAAIPDPHLKAETWATILHDDARSGRLVAAAAAGFWQYEQAELTHPYLARYFAEMPAMAARRNPSVVLQVAIAAYPKFGVPAETVAAADAMLARTDVHPLLHRIVTDLTDDVRRAAAGALHT